MNLIDALNRSLGTEHYVIYPKTLFLGSGTSLFEEATAIRSGKFDPEYLLAVVGRIRTDDLLSDDWEITCGE